MEEKINIIKENLTGNYDEDIKYLSDFAEEKQKQIDDDIDTLDAINSVIKELSNTVSNEEVIEENNEESLGENIDVVDESKKEQIDALIAELTQDIEKGNFDDALRSAESVIAEVEDLSKSNDDNKLYCSFSTEFEKSLFEYIFAGEKEVVATPYSNDVLYTVYSDILASKKRTKAAMDALDRAIYWNFLSRSARSKKIDLYFQKNEIVKCLDAIKKLQAISYTAQDLAECYNKYAYVFESLKDPKSAYALYILSYFYVNSDDVLNEINRLATQNPELADMTFEEVVELAKDNEVNVSPNSKIVSAYRSITRDFIEQQRYDEALLLVQNDYSITRDEELNSVYEQLVELTHAQNENVEEKAEEAPKKRTRKAAAKVEDNKEEVVNEKPKKAVSKTTAKKTTTKKSTSTKKTSTTKKTTSKAKKE